MPNTVVVPVVLEGQHVRLEPLARHHLASLTEAVTEDRSTYGWTWVPAAADGVKEWFAGLERDFVAGTALPFAHIDRLTGCPVGSTRFLRIEYWQWPEGNPNQRGQDRPDCVEIGGTWLAASAQRTAINTEAKLLMLKHAFETWHVHRVTLRTDERNQRSRAAIERIGAHLDGLLRNCEPASDGAIRTTAAYSMLESEWPAAKARLEARLAKGGMNFT